jgi:hypothetical protein
VHNVNVSVLAESFCRWLYFCTHLVRESRFLMQAIGKSRRFYLVHFRKDYVHQQLLLRKGHCRQCGNCCWLLFTCPMLTQQGLCLVYGKCRPQACKVFPIDQRDIEEVALCGGNCGYRFEKQVLKETGIPVR